MSRFVIAFVALVALLNFLRADAKNCYTTSQTTCSTYNHPYSYCDLTSASCKDMTTTTIGNVAGNTIRCIADSTGTGSLKVAGRCKQLLAKGCALTNGNRQTCSTVNPNRSGICSEPDITFQKEGGNCERNTDCGYNLYCNAKRVCERAIPIGERCSSAYKSCVEGGVCERGYCIVRHSLKYNDPCESDAACDTGNCDPNTLKCGFTNTLNTCLRDSDCNSQYSVCVGSNGVNIVGRCTTAYYASLRDYYSCLVNYCPEPYRTNGYFVDCGATKCNYEFAKFACSKGCASREDERFDLSQEYSFDCYAFTATPWSRLSTTSRCQISRQFSSCDSEVYNRLPSFATMNKVAFSVVAIVISLFALLL